MACGLPLLITQSGGMVEYADRSCSRSVPIDDGLAENLAKEIICLSNDKELRCKLGENGRKRAKAFSKQQYYRNFVKIVESVK